MSTISRDTRLAESPELHKPPAQVAKRPFHDSTQPVFENWNLPKELEFFR